MRTVGEHGGLRLSKHLNRGWIVAAAGFGINLTLGILYSWSIFAKALSEEWGWSSGRASLPYAVAVASFALVLMFGGRAQDRYGPRPVATLGAVLLGGGLLVSALATRSNGLPMVLGFGALTGSGIALGFVSTFPAASKWFSAGRRGLVTGLVVSGFGIASVYIAPLTTYLLSELGIRRTFSLLGVVFLAVATGLSQLVRNPPLQSVVEVSRGEPDMPRGSSACGDPKGEYDWHEMIRTRQFALLWLMYGLTAFAGIMIIGHMASIAELQLEAELGFVLVAVLALGNAAGRIVAGAISDRIGTVRTMTAVFAVQAVAMSMLGAASNELTLSGLAFAIGFNYGADLSLFPCIVAEYFGKANQGVNYGLVFTSWGVGGVFGSMLAGVIFDATGTYRPAFLLGAFMCAIAAVLTLATHPPSRQVRRERAGLVA